MYTRMQSFIRKHGNHLSLQLVDVSTSVVSSVVLVEAREVIVQVERTIFVCIEGECDLASYTSSIRGQINYRYSCVTYSRVLWSSVSPDKSWLRSTD